MNERIRETDYERIVRECRKQRRAPTFREARILAVHHSTQGAFADGNGRIEVNIRKLEKMIREGER